MPLDRLRRSWCRGTLAVTTLVRRSRGASGAVTAQLAQALTSFVLHVTAARQLGAGGLGVFALLYSGVIFVTAISTGLIGDSLTVLARGEARIRAGLQVVGAVVVLAAAIAATTIAYAIGLLGWWPSVILGAVVAAFTVEDLARRLLMASLKFWSVVASDTAALIVTVGWLLGASALTSGVGLVDLLLALLIGQSVGLATALCLLPRRERFLAPWKRPDVGSVIGFGGWRAAQQGVRPATLTATRSIAIVAVGAVAFGELEGARVYVAPALLAVNGIAAFLFSSYASQRQRTRRDLLRRADISALTLATTILLFGLLALFLLPFAGRLVTGGAFDLDGIAVFGWVVYAACTAFLTPYGGLAAVAGAQAQVFAVRVGEAGLSLLAVIAVLLLLSAPVQWVPYALGPGAVVAGLVIRQFCILRGFELDSSLDTR